ncbi:MAG: acyl carrier protein [Candidatus Izimaplasma sp.]|nr:acyl carrier protein [Candidatus Izimaplasma bacterium]
MIFDKLKKIIVQDLGVDEEIVTLDADLISDLGADSLDAVELIMTIEDEFGITVADKDANDLKTVKQIVDYIEKAKKE